MLRAHLRRGMAGGAVTQGHWYPVAGTRGTAFGLNEADERLAA